MEWVEMTQKLYDTHLTKKYYSGRPMNPMDLFCAAILIDDINQSIEQMPDLSEQKLILLHYDEYNTIYEHSNNVFLKNLFQFVTKKEHI